VTGKSIRRQIMAEVIREARPRTQQELVDLLESRECDATQATISRDMAEMGVVKGPDGYLLAEEARLVRLLADLVVSVEEAGNLAVIKSIAGGAQGVAAAIDAADIGGALGTIAGDDTILVIARDPLGAQSFIAQLARYMTGPGREVPTT
jgi:transcriptional regulator of arginine metabolism